MTTWSWQRREKRKNKKNALKAKTSFISRAVICDPKLNVLRFWISFRKMRSNRLLLMRWTCFLLFLLKLLFKKKIDNLDLEYGKAAADRLSIWIEKLRLAYNSSFPSTNCFCSFGCLASNSCRSVSFLYFLSRPVEFIMAEFKNYGHAIGSLNILRIQLTNIQNDDYHLFQRNATALRFSHIYAEERRGYWRVSDTIIFDLRV